MPDVEEKTVDIDTTGPGAEVDISEEKKEPVETLDPIVEEVKEEPVETKQEPGTTDQEPKEDS